MEIQKVLHRLRENHQMFGNFSDSELCELLKCCESKTFQENDILFREGGTSDDFHIIVSGSVNVRKRGKLVDVVTSGECIGEMGAVTSSERSATVSAKETVLTLCMSQRKLDTIDPAITIKVYKNLIGIISERLRKRLEQAH